MKNKNAPRRHHVLRTSDSGDKQRLWDLLQDCYTVGRVSRVGDTVIRMVIPGDPTISRHQCSLVRVEAGYELQNMSANGTVLNGCIVMDRAPLQAGDELRLGERAVLVFDSLTDAERHAVLAGTGSGAAQPLAESRVVEARKSQPVLLVSIAALWVAAIFITFGGESDEVASVTTPQAPFLAGPAPVSPDLQPEEADEIFRRLQATWERESRWKPSADHELIEQGLRLLARSGQTDLRALRARGHWIANTIGGRIDELERALGASLLHAERALAAGDRDAARVGYREILQRTTVTSRPSPLVAYALARLQAL